MLAVTGLGSYDYAYRLRLLFIVSYLFLIVFFCVYAGLGAHAPRRARLAPLCERLARHDHQRVGRRQSALPVFLQQSHHGGHMR